ncbi:MAG: periplasmic heavy metal sensor [Verrucomicrobiota bacterium]
MKAGWSILLGALLLLVAGILIGSKIQPNGMCSTCEMASLRTGDALAWMQKDLQLTDQEYGKVCALHDAYMPNCKALCQKLDKCARDLSDVFERELKSSAATEAAFRDYEAVRSECQRQSMQHVLETAAVMNPEAGRRFMREVLHNLLLSEHQNHVDSN